MFVSLFTEDDTKTTDGIKKLLPVIDQPYTFTNKLNCLRELMDKVKKMPIVWWLPS
jgi:hypothetical protein